MTTQPPEIKRVDSVRVCCDGDEGSLGHPRIYLNIGADGKVICPYCDREFILIGGPADSQAA